MKDPRFNTDTPTGECKLDKDERGAVLPTMRNKDVMAELHSKYKNDPNKIKELVGRDEYYQFTQPGFFNPVAQHLEPPSPRDAEQRTEDQSTERTDTAAKAKIEKINALNRQYMARKRNKSQSVPVFRRK